MGNKSQLALRDPRRLYKRLGLSLALIPSGFLAFAFSMALIQIVTLLNTMDFSEERSREAAEQLPDHVLSYFMTGVIVPMIIYFAIGGYFAFKFSQSQFSKLENGQFTSYKAIFSGWLAAFTRAHMLYLVLSSLTIVLLFAFALFYPGFREEAPAYTLSLGGRLTVSIIGSILYMFFWFLCNAFLWLVVTLPLSLVSSFILRVLCLKRVPSENLNKQDNPAPA